MHKAYGKPAPPEERMYAYEVALAACIIDVVRRAIRLAIAHRKWVPSPAELLTDTRSVQLEQAQATDWREVVDGDPSRWCEDTGFAYLERPGGRVLTMHDAVLSGARWTRMCDCRPTNGRYRAKRNRSWAATASRHHEE